MKGLCVTTHETRLWYHNELDLSVVTLQFCPWDVTLVEGGNILPIGIRAINDFAFKKNFGSPANKLVLISLLNAILGLPKSIVDVVIENPYNLQDFKDDKLSILDIRAVDQSGAIYDVEMQLSIF